MSTDALVTYHWRLTLQGHVRFMYVKDTTLEGAKEKGNRVGTVTAVERLMPVKKGKAKGYSSPVTFWQEGDKVKGG